ncbi:MAG: cytochrome c biogenesis protein ResB [Acidobacteria bacterium]|nr:cytochrome c biogenesis protein ResB [Acidobacteriota bacterium]
MNRDLTDNYERKFLDWRRACSGAESGKGEPSNSVPFGISLLILLITACMIGMVIQQQELESFSGYYAELTPGEKIIYGRLGFFNIYHAWYFNLLLLLLSLNIILASIDHFPRPGATSRAKN